MFSSVFKRLNFWKGNKKQVLFWTSFETEGYNCFLLKDFKAKIHRVMVYPLLGVYHWNLPVKDTSKKVNLTLVNLIPRAKLQEQPLQVLTEMYRVWWRSSLTNDVTAVKCCMVCVPGLNPTRGRFTINVLWLSCCYFSFISLIYLLCEFKQKTTCDTI